MKIWWQSTFLVASNLALVLSGSPAWAQDMHPVSQGLIYDALMGKQFTVKYPNEFQDKQSLPMDRGVKGSQKPLGVIAGPKRTEFNTDYINVDSKTVSMFAVALHSCIVLKKGGWENFQKANTRPIGSVENALLNTQPHPDPFKATHVSYDDMLTYARDWWKGNCDIYQKETGPLKDRFLYEAILDALRNYNDVELWTGPNPDTDHVQWCDIVLADAAQKQ